MPTDPQPWIDALQHSHERLAKLVADLDAEAVRAPSYAKEWTIADVLSHLGSGAENSRLSIDAAVAGGPAVSSEDMQPIWDAWNAKSPDEQAADVVAVDERAVQRLAELTPREREDAHLSWFGRELDLAGVIGVRLAEHAVHTWDVAVMREPGATVSADAVALILTTILRTATWAAKPTGRHFTLAIRTTEPAAAFALSVGESVTLTDGDPTERVDGTLTLTAEQFVRLVYGRLDDTDVSLEAATVTLDDVRAVFPGF